MSKQEIDDWFIETRFALSSLRFDYFDVFIENDTIRIFYASQSKFQLFEKAFVNTGDTKDIKPSLEIFCIDNKFSSQLPSPCWTYRQCDNKGYVIDADAEQKFIQVDLEQGQLKAIDLTIKLGIYYIPDTSCIPSWEFYSPLKSFFSFFCLSKHKLLVHAGSLVFTPNNNAILLVGRGGTGKSTAVLQGIKQGYKTCGDDYVIVCLKLKRIIALYATIKIQPGFITIPEKICQTELEINPDNKKHIIFINTHNFLQKSSVLSAIYYLNKNTDQHKLTQLSKAKALTHLAVSTILQIPICSKQTLFCIKSLLSNIDCYEYRITPGLSHLNAVLKKIKENNEVNT